MRGYTGDRLGDYNRSIAEEDVIFTDKRIQDEIARDYVSRKNRTDTILPDDTIIIRPTHPVMIDANNPAMLLDLIRLMIRNGILNRDNIDLLEDDLFNISKALLYHPDIWDAYWQMSCYPYMYSEYPTRDETYKSENDD